ncbi:MAG: flagellar motor protein MotB [Alphaproteobacteria bacterium]|nr:flagellar motor protein MotB [Alphaproteobacteria bacterium SS10]
MRADANSAQLTATPAGDAPAWMVTFTDLVCLMLTFFVMLFAMSVPDEDTWQEVVSALTQTDQPVVEEEELSPRPDAERNVTVLDIPQAANLDYLVSLLRQKLDEAADAPDIILNRTEDQLVLSLPGDTLFEASSAELTQEGRSAVQPIAQMLSGIENQVRLFGHADPTPLRSGAYPSNWELSLARAVTVGRFLRSGGYREDMVIAGMGDGRYGDLPATLPQTERYRLARRVDIVIDPEATQ